MVARLLLDLTKKKKLSMVAQLWHDFKNESWLHDCVTNHCCKFSKTINWQSGTIVARFHKKEVARLLQDLGRNRATIVPPCAVSFLVAIVPQSCRHIQLFVVQTMPQSGHHVLFLFFSKSCNNRATMFSFSFWNRAKETEHGVTIVTRFQKTKKWIWCPPSFRRKTHLKRNRNRATIVPPSCHRQTQIAIKCNRCTIVQQSCPQLCVAIVQ